MTTELLTMTELPKSCQWYEDEIHGYWEASCGLTWSFGDGGPEENQCIFCPKCGKPLETVLSRRVE